MVEDGVYCEAVVNAPGQKIEFKENIEGIDEWPHSWPQNRTLSYRLNNFSEDFRDDWQKRAVVVAFRAWQWRIKNLRFRRQRNPDLHVNFNIEWRDLDHFDGRKGTLAHAYFPGQGSISGDVHINDEWDYVAGTHLSDLAHPPLVPILVHEIGHSLGLRHDTKIESMNTEIMYPSFNLGRNKNALGPRTVQRIQERYGARTVSQRIIDYFLARRFRGSDFR